MEYSPLEFVKSLSFVRYGGTEAELKAAELIREEIEKAGGTSELMEFKIPASECKSFSVKVTAPFSRELGVTPYGKCGEIPAPGRDLKFFYAEQGKERDYLGIDDLSDCIVMVNALNLDAYKLLCRLNAAAILVITGKYYQNDEDAGIYARNLRPKFLENGVIPTFAINAREATEIVRDGAEMLHIELEQIDCELTSQDVLAVIEGRDIPQESIVLTAHYDSVPIGTGSWDNATGSAALLGIYRYFLKNQPRRTMRFIWCGTEEQGLYGSKAYVEQNEDLLDSIKFCFNFDMCGTILGQNQIFITGGKELETFVDQYCREIGYSASTRVCVHSSDSAPFADKGIPAIGLSRGTSTSEIHTANDLVFTVGEKNLLKNIEDFAGMVARVDSFRILPVDKGMSEEMQKELDKYFQR